MIKVMHVDTVFEVFMFKSFYFGYFFYARRGTYLMMVNFPKPSFGGKKYKNVLFGATTHKLHQSYGIKRWNTMRKKNLFLAPPIPP